MARHPEVVHTLVAHEPATAQVLPDREQALAAVMDTRETYMREGRGPGMAKFMLLSSLRGPIPANFASLPLPGLLPDGVPGASMSAAHGTARSAPA